MIKPSFFSMITITLGLLIFASCSTLLKNTDLLEYGYNGAVKTVRAVNYSNLIKKNDEWKIDKTKVESIKIMTFDESGNIITTVTKYPEYPEELETTIYQFEDGRKSGFHVIGIDKDTLETAVYNWKSETEYELTRELGESISIKSISKLNENFRDLSGGNVYIKGDSTLYANSYINTINDKNLIEDILFTNEITKEKNILTIKYSDFDANGNPLQLVMTDEKTGELDNLTIREFTYFK